MRRHILLLIIVGTGIGLHPDRTAAQSLTPDRLIASASTAAGRVTGLVRDVAGQALPDASVLALGDMIITARSDMHGHFLLSLPPGDYILKATRAGYVSNYREPVRVQSTTQLERTITLVRQSGPLADPAVDDHSHTDLAWALRHLTRTVLRDGSMVAPGDAGAAPGLPNTSLGSPRADRFAAPFAAPDFRGQLNLVTTAVAGQPAGVSAATPWPRGVAYVSLGAPVAGYGAWRLHAAVASGDGSSWNVLGAYESDSDRTHLMSLRLSYSAQGSTASSEQLSAAVAFARSVSSISAHDRWRVTPALDLEFGGRAERFDYLDDPQVFGGNLGVSYRVLPRTVIGARASQNMVAPGADEFLPPPAGGPWLPAERMFFPLTERGVLRAEEVRYGDVSLAYRLGPRDWWPTLTVRRFHEITEGQMATLFGVTGSDARGQYFVGEVGTVDLTGWGAALSGQFGSHVHGQVEYAQVSSGWQLADRVRSLRRVAPSVVRDDEPRLQDVTASIDADIPRSATHLSVLYRANTAFSRNDGAASPLVTGRFDFQVRQALPFHPTRAGRVEAVFSIRNLFRDPRGEASWYDELLTVGPPLRFMGGLQVRF